MPGGLVQVGHQHVPAGLADVVVGHGQQLVGSRRPAAAIGLTGAYASEWSLLSMYLLFIAVVTFRARGFFGKKSVLDV